MRSTLCLALLGLCLIILAACDDSGGGSAGGSGNGGTNNAAPVAVADSVDTPKDTPLDIDVLANDSDADGDTLSISSVGAAASGTATIIGALVRYIPNPAFTGADAFSYEISDGKGGTASGTVSVQVTFTNSAPVAANDNGSTWINMAVELDVLTNDSDADGHALTIAGVTQPGNGTATIVSASVRYTPAAGFTGSDSFTYTCDDGNGGTDTASVDVIVDMPSWSAAASSTVQSDQGAHSVAIGDFNNDGKPDLAVANARASTVSVHLNTTTGTGAATFATPTTYNAGIMTDIVAVDVNGDNLPDLLTPEIFDSLVVRINNPASPGNFLAAQYFSASVSGLSVCWDLATGDIDGDGDIDVVVAQMNDRAAVIMENTTGTGSNSAAFSQVNSVGTAAGFGNPMGVALGDINGDGELDLATSCDDNGGEVWVFLNTGSGLNFGAETKFSAPGAGASLAIGDIDGDGKADIAAAGLNTGTVVVLRNTTATGAATPTFATQVTYSAGTGIHDVVISDVTGDGRADLMLADAYGSALVVMLNIGTTGNLSFTAASSQGSVATPYHLAVADMNGDGIKDVALSSDSYPSANLVVTGQ